MGVHVVPPSGIIVDVRCYAASVDLLPEQRSTLVAVDPHGIIPASFAALDNLLQDERLVVLFVPRAVDQGNGARLAFLPQ